MIDAYLDSLAGALSFDRSLARRVRQEVEDHLHEAVAAAPALGRAEAEQRAVAQFGEVRLLAAQIAMVSLARLTQRAGIAVGLAIAVVLAAMKVRLAWYDILQWTGGEGERALARMVVSIDRAAFWLAAIIGLGALAYIHRNRACAVLRSEYHQRLRRALVLLLCAAAFLGVSVTGDGVLTALKLGRGLCPGAAVPIATMAIEVLCSGMLVFSIVGAARRVSSTALLLRNPSTPQG